MDDAQFWGVVRRALTMIVKAIEKRYPGGKMDADEVEEPPPKPRYLSSR